MKYHHLSSLNSLDPLPAIGKPKAVAAAAPVSAAKCEHQWVPVPDSKIHSRCAACGAVTLTEIVATVPVAKTAVESEESDWIREYLSSNMAMALLVGVDLADGSDRSAFWLSRDPNEFFARKQVIDAFERGVAGKTVKFRRYTPGAGLPAMPPAPAPESRFVSVGELPASGLVEVLKIGGTTGYGDASFFRGADVVAWRFL